MTLNIVRFWLNNKLSILTNTKSLVPKFFNGLANYLYVNDYLVHDIL